MASSLDFVVLYAVLLRIHDTVSQMSFTPVTDPVSMSFLCAVDRPSAVLSLDDLSVGIPAGVPGRVICGFGCVGYTGCTSFNYRKLPSATAQCELYTYELKRCWKSYDGTCRHFQSTGRQMQMPSCRPTANFACDINIRSYSSYGQCGTIPGLPAFVVLNGTQVWTAGWCSNLPACRGVNTMIIDPTDCTASDIRQFDTFASSSAATALTSYLASIRSGAFVIGVTGDEPTSKLSPALSQLRNHGVYVDHVQYRGSFAFVVQIAFPGKTVYVKSLTNSPPNIQLHVKVTGTDGDGSNYNITVV